jgi:PAS domain-containing protein
MEEKRPRKGRLALAARKVADVVRSVAGTSSPVAPGVAWVEPPALRSALLTQLTIAAVRQLRRESAAWAAQPEMVVAGRLKWLAETALHGLDGRGGNAAAAPPPAPPGLAPADLFLELLEAERLLEELGSGEGSPALDEERRRSLRSELRRAAQSAAPAADPAPVPADRRVMALLEELPEAILLVDEDDCVRYANARVRDVFGLEPAASTGRNLADVMAAPGVLLRIDDPNAFLEATLNLLRRRGEPCEDIFRHVDGPTFLRRTVPVGERGALGRLVITTNVTALRTRNRNIGDELRAADWNAPASPTAERPRLRLVSGGRAD